MRRTAILLAVLLAACGQAGDLYLPPPPPPEAAAPAAPATPAPEQTDKKKE